MQLGVALASPCLFIYHARTNLEVAQFLLLILYVITLTIDRVTLTFDLEHL